MSSRNPRPASPVDGDLQQLYNEVWAAFGDEKPSSSSERDLENIYNGYADDNDTAQPSSSNVHLNPPYQRTGRTPSPGPPIDTRLDNPYASPLSAASNNSPTRRRLPPTPGGSSSSAKYASLTYAMPEPTIFRSPADYHPDMKASASYTAPYSSHAEHPDLGRRSTGTADGGYRKSAEQEYANGSYRFLDESEPAPLSPSSHRASGSDTSHVNGPYSSATPNSTNPAAGKSFRPPGAAPALPPKPSGYMDRSSGSQYTPYAPSTSNAYPENDRSVYDDYQYPSYPNKPASPYTICRRMLMSNITKLLVRAQVNLSLHLQVIFRLSGLLIFR
ncbi:hypothetical protein CPC08DRAFT_143876 [Agrocybe pediades]|nr:hypothetical protein CPC08DRAFT_143876 [Agrocybe pediades]